MDTTSRLQTIEQLDGILARLQPLTEIPFPRDGWLKTIRTTLRMSGRQLARRLGISPPSLHSLEANEVSGGLTLANLRRVAEALNCRLVYALVPNTSLAEDATARARDLAEKRVRYIAHSMALEDQAPDQATLQKQIDSETNATLIRFPRNLWDDD